MVPNQFVIVCSKFANAAVAISAPLAAVRRLSNTQVGHQTLVHILSPPLSYTMYTHMAHSCTVTYVFSMHTPPTLSSALPLAALPPTPKLATRLWFTSRCRSPILLHLSVPCIDPFQDSPWLPHSGSARSK
jgi:hypothetical protein